MAVPDENWPAWSWLQNGGPSSHCVRGSLAFVLRPKKTISQCPITSTNQPKRVQHGLDICFATLFRIIAAQTDINVSVHQTWCCTKVRFKYFNILNNVQVLTKLQQKSGKSLRGQWTDRGLWTVTLKDIRKKVKQIGSSAYHEAEVMTTA